MGGSLPKARWCSHTVDVWASPLSSSSSGTAAISTCRLRTQTFPTARHAATGDNLSNRSLCSTRRSGPLSDPSLPHHSHVASGCVVISFPSQRRRTSTSGRRRIHRRGTFRTELLNRHIPLMLHYLPLLEVRNLHIEPVSLASHANTTSRKPSRDLPNSRRNTSQTLSAPAHKVFSPSRPPSHCR